MLVGGAAILLVVGASFVAARVFAAMVVSLKVTKIEFRVRDIGDNTITLPANKYTLQEGVYGARWDAMAGHARVGAISPLSPSGLVGRRVDRSRGPRLRVGTKIDWSGQIYEGPADLGLAYEDLDLATESGVAPAWYFPPVPGARTTDGSVWVIHIHGIRVTRLSPLRGVPAVAEAGAHSLVISYRGDADGPRQKLRTSTLGMTEWVDIEPAVEYAAAHGATRIVLMGWSMGGMMSLLAAHRSHLSDLIDDLLLVAPVTDWRRVLYHGAREAKVPPMIARAIVAALSKGPIARVLGVHQPLDFEMLNWTSSVNRVTKPCRVLHSEADDEVPFELTREFERLNDLVEVVELPPALHTLEWNRAPEAFDAAVAEWITTRSSLRTH